jgi:hypothetical protein
MLFAWAVDAGLVSWPLEKSLLAWLPGSVAYALVVTLLSLRQRKGEFTTAAYPFAISWLGAIAAVIGTALVMIIAHARTGMQVHDILPGLSFVYYGAGWLALALWLRRMWHGLIAIGCLATGLAMAWELNQPAAWLIAAAGLLLWVALPGAVIMIGGQRATSPISRAH